MLRLDQLMIIEEKVGRNDWIESNGSTEWWELIHIDYLN